MIVNVLEERGLDHALRGMAYSYRDRAEDVECWWAGKRERAYERMAKLAHMDGGHNKALESIIVWIDIDACRGYWSQFDTYRSGITKQSDSTMHTLAKREPVTADFEEGTDPRMIELFIQLWHEHKKDVTKLKDNLPEGYLQRRIVCTNYKTLRNIIAQRRGHRLKYWDVFCDSILAQVEHPEYLIPNESMKG